MKQLTLTEFQRSTSILVIKNTEHSYRIPFRKLRNHHFFFKKKVMFENQNLFRNNYRHRPK
jgi:hypothetical protein